MSDDLHDLLVQGRRYAAEYGPHFHNHLPMALVALDRLGAPPAHCRHFLESYVPRLSPRAPAELVIDEETWQQHLGLHEFNTEFQQFFETQMHRHGLEATLRTFLPKLLPGVSGGLFHPMIRLAYGLEVEDLWEVSEALAAWCIAYQELGPGDAARSDRSPLQILQAVAADASLRPAARGPNAMKAVAEQPGFAQWAHGVPASIVDVAGVALALYAATDDGFVALHGVTSSHAAGIVAPYTGASDMLLRFHWQALVAAYVTIGCPPIHPVHPAVLTTWEAVEPRAAATTDEHVAKLCYSAHREFERTHDLRYLWVADRKCR